MKLFYWHVMDSGKDSVDLLRRLLDRFGTGLHYVLVRNQVRGSRLQRRSSNRASRRARSAWARTSSRSRSCNEHVIQKIDSREQQLLAGQGVRQGRDRPRPDGPPARQDVAARRLPRDRRSRRLTPRRDDAAAPPLPRAARPRSSRCPGSRAAPRAADVAALRARRRLRPAARRRHGALDAPHRRRPAPSARRCAGRSPTTRRFTRIVARGEETRRGRLGAQRPRRAAPASSRRAGTGTASARSASRARSAAPAPRRPPTPRRRCASRSRAASATTSATTPPGATSPPTNLDLVLFLGDYIYEYATAPNPVRRHRRRRGLHARPVPRPLRHAQERPARCRRRTRAAPWLLVWDDHEVVERLRRPARPGPRARHRARAAPPPTAPTGSTCRFRSRRGRSTPTCASSAGSTGAALARIHLLDDRQYRDVAGLPASPAAAARTRSRSAHCPALRRPGAHACSASSRSAGSPTAGT